MPDNQELALTRVDLTAAGETLELRTHEILALIHQLTAPSEDTPTLALSQLVANLGMAATHLSSGVDIIESMPIMAGDGVVLPLDAGRESQTHLVQVEPVVHTNGTGEATLDAARNVILQPDSVDIGDQPLVEEEPPVAADHEPQAANNHAAVLETSTEIDDPLALIVDIESTLAANDRAVAKFGDAVRTVRIIGNNTLEISGTIVPIHHFVSRKDLQAVRVKTLNQFLLSRDDPILAGDLRRASGLINTAPAAFLAMAKRLSDSSGESILHTEKINEKKTAYSMAPDVVIVDERQASPQVDAPATLNSTNVVEKKLEPTNEVTLKNGAIIINGQSFAIRAYEHPLLSRLLATDEPRTAAMLAEAVDSTRAAEDHQLQEILEDSLYTLYKRGLLTQMITAVGSRQYTINLKAAETVDGKIAFETSEGTIYLDQTDLKILEILQNNGRLTAADIVHEVTDHREIPDSEYHRIHNEVSDILRKYLFVYKVVRKTRDGPNGNKVHWQLSEGVESVFDKEVDAEPVEPEDEATDEEIDEAVAAESIAQSGLSPNELRHSLIHLSHFQAVNDKQVERIAEQHMTPRRILLMTGNRVKIDGEEAVVRSPRLEVLNHLLMNIGSTVTVQAMWQSGYSLNELPLANESPSQMKVEELFNVISSIVKELNDRFGQLITVSRQRKSFGILDGYHVEDARGIAITNSLVVEDLST